MDLISASNNEVCSFLASRIRSERLHQGYSQSTMADKAGIALRTYKRIELTGTGTIQNLIVILRTLERIRAIELLFPLSIKEPRRTIIDRVQMIAYVDQMKNR
ncbi:MAG: helix-turn-helix transcriptional regulator [Candidatus Nitrotoga sp.]|nr:helix-turn-helix transcriptional regulator [Candidatus Nitrotoga sp.]